MDNSDGNTEVVITTRTAPLTRLTWVGHIQAGLPPAPGQTVMMTLLLTGPRSPGPAGKSPE